MTGSLQIKNDTFYAVLNVYKDGQRKPKWINSHLPVKGNKRNAEKFLREQISLYERAEGGIVSDTLFADFVNVWLESVKKRVDIITYQGYEQLAKAHVIPYFRDKKIRLQDMQREDIQRFIDVKSVSGRIDETGGLSARTLRLLGNVINQTLKEATIKNLLYCNPFQSIDMPAVERREPTFYSAERMEQFLEAIKNERLYVLVKITAFYGLRRSEVLGLQWKNIDFEQDTLKIAHTVVRVKNVVMKDKTKNKSSYRIFPLTPEIKNLLLAEKCRQEINRKLYGQNYDNNPYVFVWEDGTLYRPEYITKTFNKLLKKYQFPPIRFHDVRHSCASILLSRGFHLKDVQEWLGHSDIKMTANVYGHLDMGRKSVIAQGMSQALSTDVRKC